jgi:DNA primase
MATVSEEEKKLNILKNVLGDSYKNNSEYLFHCPSCSHHKRKLSVNIDKNVYKCWVCDWSGRSLYRIIRRYGNSSDKANWRSFDEEVDVQNFLEKLFGPQDDTDIQQIDLPKNFISLANKNLPISATRAVNYLESRDISKTDIIRWKIGYCEQGKYSGRVVIPSFGPTGRPNYFVSRSYDNSWKKYLNPAGSKNIIFNDLYLDFDSDIILVEGAFDAIKAGENSIPLLGSTLTENHILFQKIIENDTPVVIALDSDALKKTNKLIELFLKYDIEIRQVDISPFNDVGEMTKEQFLERKKDAVFVSHHNYLTNRISRI